MESDELKKIKELQTDLEETRQKLAEAEEVIYAIKTGAVDALAISLNNDTRIFTLQGSDHTYRIFVEEMNEGAVTISNSDTILYCNSKFANMIGIPLENVIGQSITSFITPDCENEAVSLIEKGWAGSSRGELDMIREEEKIPVQLSMKAVEIDSIKALYVVVTDITQRIKAEKELIEKNNELKRSNSDLEQFAYVSSHDLKEPLRMITSYSNLLIRHLHNPSGEILEYAQFITDNVQRMKELISDLLSYSRIGQEKVEFEMVEMNKIVSEVKELFQPRIKATDASIVSSHLPEIYGNKALLISVFQNLVDNAIKFRKPEKRLEIKIDVKREDKFFVFSFADNGIGIDQKYEDIIFVIFQRLHTREKYQGSGIGLSVCKKIIEFHGGKMWLESNENKGSTFYFSLPYKNAPQPIKEIRQQIPVAV